MEIRFLFIVRSFELLFEGRFFQNWMFSLLINRISFFKISTFLSWFIPLTSPFLGYDLPSVSLNISPRKIWFQKSFVKYFLNFITELWLTKKQVYPYMFHYRWNNQQNIEIHFNRLVDEQIIEIIEIIQSFLFSYFILNLAMN